MRGGSAGVKNMVGAIIVGAGEGKRMSGRGRKQFVKIGGKPIFAYTLEVFENLQAVDHMVAVVPRDSVAFAREEIVEEFGFKKVHDVVYGGESRQQSVYNGLKALKDKTKWVLIHDAVRPLVSESLIQRVLDAARKTGAAITGVPARDTVKQVESGLIVGTLDRRLLWLAQTPQCFRYDLITEAHRRAAAENFEATDDASLVEKYGTKVAVAVGSYSNLKVTSPEDIPIFEYFLRQDNRARLAAAAGSGKPRQRSQRPSRPSRSSRRRRRSKRR
jgi:2-C-methyl-D-erythritol 4-phosphate cytidylyltransferase